MSAESLHQNVNYQLLLMLRHEDLLPFIREQILNKTLTIRIYFTLNIFLFILLVTLAVFDITNELIGWAALMKYLGIGILAVFTILIPVHEGIHGIAYKIAGAKKVRYGVNWKNLYFYAVADKFVLGRKTFISVGLAPFTVVTLVCVFSIIFASVQLKWVLLGVFFMHTGACAGDFAMVSFYESNRFFSEMLTYDDVDKNISYFFVKEN